MLATFNRITDVYWYLYGMSNYGSYISDQCYQTLWTKHKSMLNNIYEKPQTKNIDWEQIVL